MPRAAAKAKPEPTAEDPLADLRDDADTRYPDPATTEDPQETPQGPAVLLEDPDGAPYPDDVQQAFQAAVVDLMPEDVTATTVDEAIERWHADTVSLGFLHKGGRCGCHYLARVVLGA